MSDCPPRSFSLKRIIRRRAGSTFLSVCSFCLLLGVNGDVAATKPPTTSAKAPSAPNVFMHPAATTNVLNETQALSSVWPQSLADFLTWSDAKKVLQVLATNQAPVDCSTARYLILDDINPYNGNGAGWGWSYWLLSNWLLQATVERRVLVFAGNALPAEQAFRWRWCEHPPYSYQCYFEFWSPCESWLLRQHAAALSTAERHHSLPVNSSLVEWTREAGVGPAQWVVMRGRTGLPGPPDYSRVLLGAVILGVASPSSSKGLLWWMARAMQIMLRPKAAFQLEVNRFLQAHGALTKPFIAAHVRRGHEHIEQAPVSLQHYQTAILRMAHCFAAKHVLLITESESVVQEMEAWLLRGQHNLTLFYTKNPRADADVWNLKLRDGGVVNVTSVDMDVEGHTAAFNMVAAGKAAGLVGTLHSTWGKVTAGYMYAHRFATPPPVISLVSGWQVPNLVHKSEQSSIVIGATSKLVWNCSAFHTTHSSVTGSAATTSKVRDGRSRKASYQGVL